MAAARVSGVVVVVAGQTSRCAARYTHQAQIFIKDKNRQEHVNGHYIKDIKKHFFFQPLDLLAHKTESKEKEFSA